MQALRVFCDVASLRSFSEAATRHSITQSAVSQRVRHLEERLGVQLLDRSVRPFALTAAGELLAREGREILNRYDELTSRVVNLEEADTLRGEVRVDAIYSAGIDLLNQLRDRFVQAQPDVNVVLDYKRPEQVAQAVREGRCDLGIISFPKNWNGVKVKPLRDERMCLVCATDNPLASADSVDASELGEVAMVGFENELPVSRAVTRYLRSSGVKRRFTSVVDNIDTMKSLIAVTDQVAILPQRTVLREVKTGMLSIVPLTPHLSRPMGAIFARSADLSAAGRSFLDFLVKHAGPLDEATANRLTLGTEAHG